MFTKGKPAKNTSAQQRVKPFFHNNSDKSSSMLFFKQSPSANTIQKKCATCDEEEKIQTKLTIAQADDPYEREADAIADQVVNTSTANIQRQVLGEDEEVVQAKPITAVPAFGLQKKAAGEEEKDTIQAKSPTNSEISVPNDLSSEIHSTQGGQTLAGSSRNFFESRIGHDFSDVKIHNDSRANHLARSINAKAFTHGRDIFFGSGEYQPHSKDGQHLLAHELTHVVQQRGNNNNTIHRQQMPRSSATRLTPMDASTAREFIEECLRFWESSVEFIGRSSINQTRLIAMLNGWQTMVNTSWRLIDTYLDGDAALLNRLQTMYRNSVSALINKASSDQGVTQQQLYQQHNILIAWWARRTLAPREDIVFILGGGDSFYQSATQYFNFIGARIITNLRSLTEVRDWLNNNQPNNGLPWGDVSIVVHANFEGGMQTTVELRGDRVTPASLRRAIENQSFRALPDTVMDNASRVLIRGCALGRNRQILQLLRSAFGGNEESPQVLAPVHLQTYEYQWQRRGRRGPRETTSAEEYFQEFWYIGFPMNPAPNRRAMVSMFNAKYPGVNVNWAAMLRARGATRRMNYNFSYTIEQSMEAPAGGSSRAAQRRIANFLRGQLGNPQGIANIRETSRTTAADGTIEINFSYTIGNNSFTYSLPGLLPRMTSQRQYRNFLMLQDDLSSATRPLEEESNLTANDFFWRLQRVRNRGTNTFNYRFTGHRTLFRIQRDLVEPDPNRAGRTRRVAPDLNDPTHYGREVPPNY